MNAPTEALVIDVSAPGQATLGTVTAWKELKSQLDQRGRETRSYRIAEDFVLEYKDDRVLVVPAGSEVTLFCREYERPSNTKLPTGRYTLATFFTATWQLSVMSDHQLHYRSLESPRPKYDLRMV